MTLTNRSTASSRTPLRFSGACLLLLAMHGQFARGDMVVQVERLGDTRAIISGMGTLGTYDNLGGRAVFRFFDGPITGDAPSSTTDHSLTDNSLTIGNTTLTSASTLIGSPVVADGFFLRTTNQPADGSVLDGSVVVELNAQHWAPIGTSGDVVWGNVSNTVGTWTIVSPTVIPEPSSFSLLACLMSAPALKRRRRIRRRLHR